jgi:two-component sensor histidine kinase
MKFKLLHSIKCFFILFVFVAKSLQSFSFNSPQKLNQLEEIKRIKGLKNQYQHFYRSIYVPDNQITNLDDWVNYWVKESKQPQNFDEIAYINFILIYLYRQDYQLEKAIELGLSTYYSDFKSINDNGLICEMLRIVEWCYHKKNDNLGLIRINKEKFKVCDRGFVDYYSAYYNMGLFDLALKSYKENIEYNSPNYKNKDLYTRAFNQNDIGVYYMYDNKIDSALYHYNKSRALFKKQIKLDSTFKKNDVQFMLNIVNGNIGTCFLKKGKFESAIPLLLDEIAACNVYYKGRNWLGSEKPYSRLALCYLKTRKFKEANIYIKKVYNYKDLYYKLKSEYYNLFNNRDSTLYFKDKYISTTDSIFKQKIMQKDIESLNSLNFNDRLKEQEKQIFLLQENDKIKSLKIKGYVITSLVVLLLFFLLLYLYFDIKKKQNLVEIQKNKIETALNNNKTLLKELNHRVKNNLQMASSVISLQASKIKDKESKKHFYKAINRIKVLSKIHNSLYSKNHLDQIDLLNYVTILKNYLVKSIINPEIKVNFNIQITPALQISNDAKTTIGLIINELITNSFKYAFSSKENNLITISIYKKENLYYFSYSDNGKGFNYERIDKTKSIGLNLILRLVNQLGEEAEINASNGMNVNFSFSS